MERRDEAKTPKMSKAARKSLAECEKAVDAYLQGFEKAFMVSHIQNDNPNMPKAKVEKCAEAFLERERRES